MDMPLDLDTVTINALAVLREAVRHMEPDHFDGFIEAVQAYRDDPRPKTQIAIGEFLRIGLGAAYESIGIIHAKHGRDMSVSVAVSSWELSAFLDVGVPLALFGAQIDNR